MFLNADADVGEGAERGARRKQQAVWPGTAHTSPRCCAVTVQGRKRVRRRVEAFVTELSPTKGTVDSGIVEKAVPSAKNQFVGEPVGKPEARPPVLVVRLRVLAL